MAYRVLIDECRPALFALAGALAALVFVVRLSGSRLDLRRLGQLHSCERGGVQSLSFVLTLPIFVMLVMFIVQVSQLMIAQVVVNYAAYGAARSLQAWIPQHVVEVEPDAGTDPFGLEGHVQNKILHGDLRPGASMGYWYVGGTRDDGFVGDVNRQATENIYKLDYPFRSAVASCAMISPSRPLGLELTSDALDHLLSTRSAWTHFVGGNASADTNRRLYNKFCYSYWNTEMWVRFQNLDSNIGPTYNPLNSPAHDHLPNEIGWRDPITVTIRHNFALLPGPGRMLAKFLVRPGGPPDMVSHRIGRWAGPRRRHDPTRRNPNDAPESDRDPHDPEYNKRVYATTIWARATVTNDGVKSLVPYVHAFEAR